MPFIEVLLVEDNYADAELVLASLGPSYRDRVKIVRDGVEALDFLSAHGLGALRLVLLDVKLPRVDGLAVLREIKSRADFKLTPVVMLTSSNIPSDVGTAYALGANSYVQKPVQFDAFRAVVRAIGQYWLELNEVCPRPRQEGRS